MSDATLPVLVAREADGATILRAPKLGLWSEHPRNGTFVEAGSPVGILTQLRRRYALVVPDGVSGRVDSAGRPQSTVPVEYGERLLRVVAAAGRTIDAAGETAEASLAAHGALQIVAPTDGVFYRSPAIGSAPYVVAGARVVTGQPVGLIEVMKTFNPIVYGGAGLPDEAQVVDVLVADGAEIRAGQPLVIVKTL
jgi:acetyl-CoA carboxylase biotin carboxyl carrier protein